MGKQWKQCQTLFFGGTKITADGDCSHKIKRCLLLGRKVMTNLDTILKSKDINLSTKVLLVKAMVFPVVMYGCESWTMRMILWRRKWQSIPVFWPIKFYGLYSPWGCKESDMTERVSLSLSFTSSEYSGLIPLQSKGLSRVFSNTTVQKHQFFGAQLSL